MARTCFSLVLLDDVSDKVQLGVDDPLREERHDAASQPNNHTQRDSKPAANCLPLPP